MVGDVIAEIKHRRRVGGGNPDRYDPKADKIFEPPLYPLQIAYAVVVGILKRAQVDLIDHTRLPPECGMQTAPSACEKIAVYRPGEVETVEPHLSRLIEGL